MSRIYFGGEGCDGHDDRDRDDGCYVDGDNDDRDRSDPCDRSNVYGRGDTCDDHVVRLFASGNATSGSRGVVTDYESVLSVWVLSSTLPCTCIHPCNHNDTLGRIFCSLCKMAQRLLSVGLLLVGLG